MNRLSTRFGTAALVLLAAAASQTRADFMNWTYTSTPNVTGISVGATSPDGGASVSLTNFNNGAGAATIPVVAYVTSTSSTNPITFGPSTNLPPTYNLALTITDGTTHDSGTLNFTGTLAGDLTATSSSVSNSLTPVTSNSLTLDGHTYTVSIPTVTLNDPTKPQSNIMANVTVTDANNPPPPPPPPPPNNGGGGGNVHTAPEPASLMLGSLGFSCFGLGCWWKRLRRRPQQPAEVA